MKTTLLFCSFLTAFTLPALTVVKDGKSDYVIVVSPKAERAARAAAADIREYIFKATGAKLPIVKEGQAGSRPAFRMGYEKINAPEGFAVRVKGRDIHISGDDTPGDPCSNHWATGARTGTWYGACDFLERFLGVRWFMPGELGEYVPKTRDLIIPDTLNYEDAPRMHARWQKQVGRGRRSRADKLECMKWRRRNREGQAEHWCAWHSWLRHLKGSDYFKDHPEYFALVGGRRFNVDPLGHGLQLCTTNPGALDQFAKNLMDYHKKHFKHMVMMSLTPNDGGFFCECSACQALDNGVRPDGSRIMTDRIATYANEVAKRVCKVMPDQKFGLLAYAAYAEGVGKVKLHDNIRVMEVLNDAGLLYYNPAVRKAHRANLKAWRSKLKQLYFDTWTEGMGGLGLPCFQFRNLCMLYDDLYDAGVTGICVNGTSDFACSGLNYYFYMKFAWAPVKEREKAYDEAIAQCYGPAAAKVVKAYFEDVEKRMAAFARKKVSLNREMGYVRRHPGVITDVYPGLCEAWHGKLSAVAPAVTDKGQRRRLRLLIDNLEYTRTTCDLYAIAVKLRSGRSDVSLAAEGDRLARLREKQIAGNRALPAAGPESYRGTEKSFFLPLQRDVFAFLLSEKSRKSAKVERRKTAPVLDGKFDEPFWRDIPVMQLEVNANGVRQPVGSQLRMAVTDEALYLAVHNPEPLMSKVKDSATKPGSNIWQENYVDLFFRPAGAKNEYKQLMFNTLGTLRAFVWKNGESSEWPVGAKIAVSKTEGSWDAEVMIPLKDLVSATDISGDIWGFNACRVRRVVRPASAVCWSPTFGGFHNAERFGKVIFK